MDTTRSPMGARTKSAQPNGLSGALDISVTKFLREHVLFKDVKDEKFIDKLAASLQIRMYADRDLVIKKGDVGRAMFFILKGQIEVISEDGETTSKVLVESEFFGEIGVLFSVPRTVSCRARGRCLLLILTKDALAKASEEYPVVAESIALIAQERFSSYVKQKKSDVKVDFGQEITLGLTQTDLKNVPLFRDCEVGFLHMLALSLTPVQYHINDRIIRKGDQASEMFFVVRGICEVFNEDDGKVYAQFTPGSFFGEVGLFFDMKRTATVHCVTEVVDVFKLTRESLDKVLENYPEVSQKIKVEAKQRFIYNQEREKVKLSEKRRVQTEHEVIREKLKSVPYFKDGSIGFLHQLALLVKFKDFKESQLIIKKDEPGDSMFFILDGAAQVVSADGKTVFAELATNAFFGEVSLFYQTNRTANVRARTHTTVLEISKDALFSVVEQHPELKEVMMAKAKENYDLFLKRQQALSALKKTPSDIGEEFDLDATVERLRKVAYFETCQIGFLKNLALTTSVRRYKKAELIVKMGDISKEMFFVVDGQVEIISETGQVFDSVTQGGFFGEVGIIKAVQRTASVRVASELCAVIVLTGDSLKKFVTEYPDSFQSIAFECEKRLRKIEERREISLSASMNRTSGSHEPIISTQEVGKIMSQGPIVHMADEFTDAIKLNKKDRHTITNIFRSRESSREPRQQSVTASEMQEEKPLDSNAAYNLAETASLDSIQDPEPKKGMKISEQAPASAAIEKKAPVATERPKGTFGKIFSSIKNSITRRTSSNKILPVRSKVDKREDASVYESVYRSSFTDSILDLPDNDFSVIMSRLKPAEKLRMRLVCRRWAEVFHQNHMWQRLDLRTLFRTFNSDKIFIFSELAGEALKEINLSGCWQIGDEDLRVLSVTCPNISILSISNCWKISDKGLSALAQGLTRLTELDMSYCGQLTCSSFTDHNWGRLQKVDFSYCKQMGDEHLEALLSRTSDIRSLSFRRCTRITDFGLFLVVRYCRRLQFLDLGDCDHISDKCLKWIASSCTNLAYLNLRFCTRITNGGLYDLSLGVQNFTSLKLNHCTQLTDASIIFFSDNIRSLRHMYLRRCRKITETTANYLLQASPQLQLLDMTGCPHVSSRIKAAIEGPHPGITVRVDMTREERGIPPPRFVSKEMPVNVKYTSGPRDVMLGITTRNKTGDAIGAGGASREGREKKKKKGSKSPSNSFMMD